MQIVIGKLGSGVTLDREREILLRHAAPVIGDADQPPAAARKHDLNPPRAGVERVLDELLHDRRRPLDDLAGCDLALELERENGDATHDAVYTIRRGSLRPSQASTSPRCASAPDLPRSAYVSAFASSIARCPNGSMSARYPVATVASSSR